MAAWLIDGDTDDLVRAGLGWLTAGGFYYVMWWIYPRGMGYGDVRLSGLLGIALGYLGWPEFVVGMYSGFLVGGDRRAADGDDGPDRASASTRSGRSCWSAR